MIPLLVSVIAFTLILGVLAYRVGDMYVAKFAAAGVLLYAAATAYFSFDDYMGWPKHFSHSPERDILLVGVFMRDPSPGVEGKILAVGYPCFNGECERDFTEKYVFMLPARQRDAMRLMEFPYTDESRRAFAEAKQNIERGGRSVLKGSGEMRVGDGSGPNSKLKTAGAADTVADGQDGAESLFAPKILNEGPQSMLPK